MNVTFTDGGSHKIFVTSDSVTGSQSFGQSYLLGSFRNQNINSTHFFSETPHPQTHGRLNKVNLLNVTIYDEEYKVINASTVHHIAICFIMVKNKSTSDFMLSLSAEVQNYGSEQNVMRYLCTARLPRGIRINDGAQIALTDVHLPTLYEVNGEETRSIIGDHNGGVIHYTIESSVVSTDSDIGSDLLRSFCLKTGNRLYTPPFLLYTKMNPGEHREITFIMKVHACADLLKFLFRGNLEVNLSIKM